MGALYLAWCYLLFHWRRSLLLMTSIMLVLSIPGGLWVLARQAEQHLAARANSTPLVIGPRGSPLELILHALYFPRKNLPTMQHGELLKVAESQLALPIPLHLKFHSQNDPIVGTSLDYFSFRGLSTRSGRLFARLGDCVLGAHVARRRGIATGETIVSSPASAFDVTGAKPLRLRVTGILAPSGTPDDDAIFVDLKTAWVIEGIGHGHDDVARNRAPGSTSTAITATTDATYTEVTDENIDSFHFHGDPAQFPLSAIIAVPPDEKSATRLLGRYQNPEHPLQMVEPSRVMAELLQTIVTVKTYALAALIGVGTVALVLLGLVQLLSFQLRAKEFDTLHQIGASTSWVRLLWLSETVMLVSGGLLGATIIILLVRHWLRDTVQLLL